MASSAGPRIDSVTFQRKEDDNSESMLQLVEGSEIKLLDHFPRYRVTKIDDSGKGSITMELQGKTSQSYVKDGKQKTLTLPQTIVFEGGKTSTIGRGGDSDIVVNHDSISRTHVSVHYDRARHAFMMNAHNRNPGTAYAVRLPSTEQAADILGAAQTIMGTLREMEPQELPLRPGMLIQLMPNNPSYTTLPTYEVKKAIGGSKPQLLLEAVGDDHGYPPRIELEGKAATKAIGRGGADYNFNHPKIHRLHSNFSWDDTDKNWVYMSLHEPPVVQVGNKFLQDMHDACARVAPADSASAKSQIRRIDGLISDMQKVRTDMQNVQQLEQATVMTPFWMRGVGASTEDSQRGYKNWLMAYQLLYAEKLSAADSKALNKAAAAVGAIGEYRAELRDMESYAEGMHAHRNELNWLIKAKMATNDQKKSVQVMDQVFAGSTNISTQDLLHVFKGMNHAADMKRLVDQELGSLAKNPPEDIFPVSGYHGHHTVTRIQRDDKGYVVTTYNAGGGSKDSPDGSGMVMAMYRQRLKPEARIRDFVYLLNERKMLGMGADGLAVERAMESMLGPVIEHRDEIPQGKGNCTTRSTREMLKDILPEATFMHMHQHVSNPEVCDPAEVMAALQMRRDALDAYVKRKGDQSVVKPEDQRDWGESVSNLRIDGSQAMRGDNGEKPSLADIVRQRPSTFRITP